MGSLTTTLSGVLLEHHPARAAPLIERATPERGAALLEGAPDHVVARVLQALSPAAAPLVATAMPAARAARALATMDLHVAARLLRRLEPDRAGEILGHVDEALAQALRTLIHFAPDSAGALMDPRVLALVDELRASEATAEVARRASEARYNIYVIDRDDVLIGVLNMRELFVAPGDAHIRDLMRPRPQAIRASAGPTEILLHRGWREVHSLPVVDDDGAYLGAIRYRAFRNLEERSRGRGPADVDAAQALGEVFTVGASSILGALEAIADRRGGGRS